MKWSEAQSDEAEVKRRSRVRWAMFCCSTGTAMKRKATRRQGGEEAWMVLLPRVDAAASKYFLSKRLRATSRALAVQQSRIYDDNAPRHK